MSTDSLIQFVESITDATGPYTDLNGHRIVADARRVLGQHAATPDVAQIVEDAFFEGFYNGDTGNGPDLFWEQSKAKAAIAAMGIAQVQSDTKLNVSSEIPVVGQLRDTDKGCDVWTGEEWRHHSDLSSQAHVNRVFDYLNPPTCCGFCRGLDGRHYQDCVVTQPKPVSVSLERCVKAAINNRRHGLVGVIDPNWQPSNHEYGNIKAEVESVLNAAGVAYVD